MAKRYANFWQDFPKRLVEGLSSRFVCRWCGKRLPGRRTSYCSDTCRAEVEVRCGWGVLHRVFERDGGTCNRCGLDTQAMEDRLRAVLRRQIDRAGLKSVHIGTHVLWIMGRQHPKRAARLHRFWARLCLTPHDAQKSLWEAHHTIPVADGTPPCGLEGYETLCIWCHRQETAAWRAKRAGKSS